MNKKLIAVAVAGIVAAPAANADEPTLEERVAALEAPPSISAYGRIQNKIVISDDGSTDSQNITTGGSRFGFKGSGDIGNGMNAFARYEFGTNTDNASGDNASGITRRLAFVGMSGPFGSVSIGQQWSAYYQGVGTHASPNISSGPGQQLGPFRNGNTIQYSNSFGPISMVLDARVDDADDGGGNGFGLGATLRPMDNFLISGGFDSNDTDNTDTMGVSAVAGFGILNFTVSHEQQDEGMMEHNNTLLAVGASVTNQLYLSAAVSETEKEMADGMMEQTDRANISAAYRIGGGLRTWIEFANTDKGGGSESDEVAIGLRMDF